MGSSLFDELFGWLQQPWYVVAIDLLLTALIAFPLLDFLINGWARKEDEISKCITLKAKQSYLKVYHQIKADDAAATFTSLYRQWYGRRRFALPIIFVLLVALIEDFLLSKALFGLLGPSKTPLEVPAAAIAGAYTFVAWDFFGRMQRRNVSPADICRGALRLAIAIPVGFVFSTLLPQNFGSFIAFAIGVFPVGALGAILRQLANKRLGLEIGAADAKDQVGNLSGVDLSIASRIEDADITTIPQLAWCDPIQLAMRSDLGFGYVLDVVSQALAWVYLGDRFNILRTIGLRGAYEIKVYLMDLRGDNVSDKRLAEQALPVAANLAGCPTEGLLLAFDQIANDPNTNFLYEAA
jgi:hypothetical protein